MDSNRAIIVYTHQGCPGGDRAISFFKTNQIPVTVRDIVSDPQALDEFQKHGCFATPVIMIDGRKYVGFDEEAVQHALSEAHKS